VIYTSGSTGQPKGVMIEHRGLCNLARAQIEGFRVLSSSRVLQFASLSFDACISEVVMALCSGAMLCLTRRETLIAGDALLEVLKWQAITHVTLPPVVLGALPHDELPALETLIVAGEACSSGLMRYWGNDRRFINAYGPTETTVCATMHLCDSRGETAPPIGRPIQNTRIYILDQRLQPVPLGIVGEIYIGGDGVARGYLNRPELTAARFIADPFSEKSGARLYKSGDLGRYRPDGTIEYLGRNDHQVKIRGFRVELGEIEAKLAQHPQLKEVVVLAREDVPGTKRLVAYFTHRGDAPSNESLREHLERQLPGYMIPSAYVQLDNLPLTVNGKLNRAMLPVPELDSYVLKRYEAPEGEIEVALAGIWQELLHVERVGRQDNFFDLGGHSLLAMQLITRAREALQVDIPVITLFQSPVLADLAEAVFMLQLAQFDPADIEKASAEVGIEN